MRDDDTRTIGGGDRVLVVNADDFGLTSAVSAGILRAHRDGVVTSTSVLAVGRVFDRTIGWLRDSGMGVGVHLALVGEDPPLLSAAEVPTLLVAGGGLRPSWVQYVRDSLRGRIDPMDVRRELVAQIERVDAAGIPVTHLDTHQHLHLLPPVAAVILELGRSAGISAIRLPGSRRSGPRELAMRVLARRLRRTAARRGFRMPDGFLGHEHSGHMTRERLVGSIESLAASGLRTAEIGVHPGLAEDPERLRFEWGFEWGLELEALCSPEVRQAVDRCGFRLGTFADLGPA